MIGQFLTGYDSWLYCRTGLQEGPLQNFTTVAKLPFLLKIFYISRLLVKVKQDSFSCKRR